MYVENKEITALHHILFSSETKTYNMRIKIMWCNIRNIQKRSYQTRLNLFIHLKIQFCSFQQDFNEEEDTVSSKVFQIVILQVQSSPENVGKAHLWNVRPTLYLHDCELLYVSFYMLEASSYFANGFGLGDANTGIIVFTSGRGKQAHNNVALFQVE